MTAYKNYLDGLLPHTVAELVEGSWNVLTCFSFALCCARMSFYIVVTVRLINSEVFNQV